MTIDDVLAWATETSQAEKWRLAPGEDLLLVSVPVVSLARVLDHLEQGDKLLTEALANAEGQLIKAASLYRQLGAARLEREWMEDEWLGAACRVAKVCEVLGVNYVMAEWPEILKRLTELIKLEAEARKLKDNGKELP